MNNLSQEEYNALVRDAMLWRSRGNPHARDQALDEAARIVQLELRKFWPHGKNAAAAILALKSQSTGDVKALNERHT